MNIIIAGAGDVGRHLISRLVEDNHDVTIIDRHGSLLEKLAENHDVRTICGSASSLSVLQKAGIATADIIVAATDSDETNLITCLIAKSQNSSCRKIARVRDSQLDNLNLGEIIGEAFDGFINSHKEAADYILRLLKVPGAVEVIDLVKNQVRIVGFTIRSNNPVVGKKLKELRDETPMLVIAILRNGDLIIPSGEDDIVGGDVLYVIAATPSTDRVFEVFSIDRPQYNNVCIYGGSSAGQEIARSLAKSGVTTWMIEPDLRRCGELADSLHEVLVLNGDATDQELLIQEGIENTDIFIAVTADEEQNILATLLAKRLGAKAGAIFVNKEGYMNLVSTIGVDIVVSPRVAAAQSILKYVRSGNISSAFSTRDDTAEIVDALIDGESRIAGQAVSSVNWPSGVIVAAIVHEDSVTIPRGDTVISEGDHAIFFASRRAVGKLEKLLKTGSWLF